MFVSQLLHSSHVVPPLAGVFSCAFSLLSAHRRYIIDGSLSGEMLRVASHVTYLNLITYIQGGSMAAKVAPVHYI